MQHVINRRFFAGLTALGFLMLPFAMMSPAGGVTPEDMQTIPWTEALNQESYWEDLYDVDCTKYENHGGSIPSDYDVVIVKSGSDHVTVWFEVKAGETVNNGINPANGLPYGSPFSWVMKCNGDGETTTTTTLVDDTTTTTLVDDTTTTTLVDDTTTTTLVEVNPICVDCNNATVADLMQLQGVDEPLALAIIANRPYETLQDLVDKGVMSPGALLLILAVNLNTGAFAGPECLSLAVETTTTTEPGETTTTLASPTTTESTPVDTLPFTGPADNVGPLAGLALALVAAGGLGLFATRKEQL